MLKQPETFLDARDFTRLSGVFTCHSLKKLRLAKPFKKQIYSAEEHLCTTILQYDTDV